MTPSRIHRTRPLLSPTDLPSALGPTPASSLRLAHYASPCGGLTCVAVMPPPAGGCVFLIGRNTSSATNLIVGLTAAAPNRPAPGTVPRGNALVTRALHYLLSSAMLPQIVHCPRATSSRAARSAPAPRQQASHSRIDVDAPTERKTIQSGTRPGRPLAHTESSQN